MILPTIALLLLLPGCGKTDYGAGCKKKAEITSPWSGMGLPVDDKKNTRVCSSNDSELKLRSYAWKTKSDAREAIGSAVIAAGYEKDRCSDQACYYIKDGYQVSVQPMDFSVKKKKLQNVVLRRRKAISKKR